MFGKKTPGSRPPGTNLPVVPMGSREVEAPYISTEITSKPAGDFTFRKTTKAKPGFSTTYTEKQLETPEFAKAKTACIDHMLDHIDFDDIEKLSSEQRKARIGEVANDLIASINIPLSEAQIALLKTQILDEVLGFGPLEVLLADPDVSDIMINTHQKVYIERAGKLFLSDVTFTSHRHLMNIIQKIVGRVGRRVDESSPLVDARLPDGSRFNAIIPPLALDGSLVSIRKFKKNKMPLVQYIDYGSMTPAMVRFLEICGNIRLNIIISGGTGSGKTTLLNAISGHISDDERVITIEDAAELQLQQPHVLRLETRPANVEGKGEIGQRQLVKNALRMRPDRIILGEIRGEEVIDVLAAMNTGHDGSMATIHANNPRDCLARIENLVTMTGMALSIQSVRYQIASAVNLIVQIARMRDGRRRITQIEEITGIDGETIQTQTLFGYKTGPMNEQGIIQGEFYATGVIPNFLPQAEYFNRDKELLECIQGGM